MSVIIKGMEMPENCADCMFVDWRIRSIYPCIVTKLPRHKYIDVEVIAMSHRHPDCPLEEAQE